MTSLSDIVIPAGVTSIEGYAFGDCENLGTILFQGDAPSIGEYAFRLVSATAYYPEGNATWTSEVMQNYGGTITWVAYTPEPEPVENPFTDVPEGEYYYEPVLWAAKSGLTLGISASKFAPNNTCTRGQIVTLLWRAAGCPEPTSDNNPFTDVKEGDYFYKAILWAVEKGITTGMSKTKFGPNDSCTRAQAVTFMWRAAGKPAPTSKNNPFSDVAQGEYYTEAVLWAAENGITQGMSATKFAPNNTCTRGQIVTFLYRAYAQ